MSARREPSTPPELPGHDYVRLLGMGGFADVFLYAQRMPRRSVAVKVLLAGALGDDVRERFRHEADLMARLSHHPSIVTIHHADVAPDGRPYLVMEYCSRPGLGQRYRGERMGVAEVLRIGVRLASAVETAHRAGILHRDIKPANVLVTDFGWPALTDFGIAATTGWSSGAAVGMSIPWSPPELLAEEPHGDVRSDVYSLAATVYSLLARRSPFEVPDGSNTAADLIARIERAPLPPVGRGDVPDSLHAVLARAMEREPARRHPSALAFARALQQVEAELLLPLTPLDLPEEVDAGAPPPPDGGASPDAGSEEEGGQATRLRPVRSVSPDAPEPVGAAVGPAVPGGLPVPGGQPAPVRAVPVAPHPSWPVAAPAAGTGPAAAAPAAGHGSPAALAEWQARADAVALESATETSRQRPGRTGRVVAAAVGGVVVAAALVTGAVLAFGPDATADDEDGVEPTPTASAQPVLAVAAPEDLEGTPTADGVTFTWTNPEPQDGDTYLWAPVVGGVVGAPALLDEPSVTVPPDEAGAPVGEVCVQVSVVRADRRASEPVTACAGGAS